MFRASALVLGVLCSAMVCAEPVTISFPASGPVLAAGESVEVRIAGVPEDVDEFEVILVVGGERPFAFRVTPSLSGETRSFSWTIPNLDLAEARLKIRMDRDDREVDSDPSEPFRIEASPEAPLTRLEPRWGEVWIDPDDDGDCGPPELPAAGLAPPAESLSRPGASVEGILPQHPRGTVDSSSLALSSSGPSPRPTIAGARISLPRTPRFIPPRI